MAHVLELSGAVPFADIDKRAILAGRERRADRASAANNFIGTMRALFAWAVDAEHIERNPCDGVENVKRPKTGGFHAWTEAEISKFEARWPVGTRERLALAILLYTGLRRGDAARLGPQHVHEGVIVLDTEKTGTPIAIPILPALAEVIAATPTGAESFIATAAGRPMVKEGFGNWFREACDAAGVPGSAHGLRKAGAARAANNGATVDQLKAVFGWTDSKMPSLYTRSADRVRLAREAMGKLERPDSSVSIPEPNKKSTGETDKKRV